MTPEETARSYDALASHWDGASFNRENGIPQHRRALQFVKHRRRAINIGCGSSGRFIQLLLEEGFEVEGLDISPNMLERARRRHPEQTFHQADICEWEPVESYDFITAWDSIWHVPLDRQAAVLEKCCNSLTDDGVFIFTSGGVDAPGEVTNPFQGQPLYHAAPGIPQLLDIVARSGCICRHLEYDQLPENHLYLIVQKV